MNKLARILQNNLDITMDLWYDNCVHISYIRGDVLLLAKISYGECRYCSRKARAKGGRPTRICDAL